MFGCLRRLGCLVILLILLAAGWYWYARVEPSRSSTNTPASQRTWEPLSQANGARGQQAVASLGQRSGPVFANLSGSEAASYIFLAASKQALPPSAQNVSAAVLGDRLYVKANVVLNELGGRKVLGPLASLLSDRDSVQLGGTMNVIRPGLGQFVVQDVKLGSLKVPSPLVPRLIQEIRRGDVPDGVAQNGFPMPLPNYISDIRISNGRITIYKNTP
ncbi:MAG TPA: hypothetical protein VM099_12380 [Gemmatimonadaceae bacterium]|nr:hypothetical protein [Gemmatimonadaceae bacterium]